jgi:hypothetical protein
MQQKETPFRLSTTAIAERKSIFPMTRCLDVISREALITSCEFVNLKLVRSVEIAQGQTNYISVKFRWILNEKLAKVNNNNCIYPGCPHDERVYQ